MKIVKNDKVLVISGRDKGTEGEVLAVFPKEGKVLVKGVSVALKHKKPRRQGEEGGIIKLETPINACKVMVVCKKCNKPTRVAYKLSDDGKKREFVSTAGQSCKEVARNE